MITLPNGLDNFMKGKDLKGLKPFAYLFRNKWVEESESGESGSLGGYYTLDPTPIDISALIVKPNTLSMTLDVNEIAQYNANNVTLTLSDTKNIFVEGTPNSYFPEGYQIYGSRVVLYYGLDSTNRTALFTGVIKDLPTYKPEKYQVDLKLVSPLEMLKDIEAKDFSDKYYGEELHFEHNDDDQHPIYSTLGTGVGGFSAVYADGTKLFEGVDYETDQMNALDLPALVTIINADYRQATITADYYCWKTGLTVEQIVAGLVALAGYNSGTEDIRAVAWNTAVRNPPISSPIFAALGYYESALNEYSFLWEGAQTSWDYNYVKGGYNRRNILPNNFDYSFLLYLHTYTNDTGSGAVSFGDEYSGSSITYGNRNIGECGVKNGISIRISKYGSIYTSVTKIFVYQITDSVATLIAEYQIALGGGGQQVNLKISRRGNTITVYKDNTTEICSFTETRSFPYQRYFYSGSEILSVENQTWNIYDNNLYLLAGNLTKPCIITQPLDKTSNGISWGAISADLGNLQGKSYFLNVAVSTDGVNWGALQPINLNTVMGFEQRYLYYVLGIENNPSDYFDIINPTTYYYALNLLVNLVNLSDKTVLDALQDFALISGYEFGVDRNGVFFFRPRVASTTPTYDLGHEEIAKVDTIKKNLSDFFTKLTLTFAQVPLEFYANSGTRPTLVDKYGVINKEIDKPEIVNYDNPELAQAIGPQLLEVYSSMPNVIQATGKLNLAIELGDIVNLKRNYPLVEPDNASDYTKFENQQTYYRACKVIGMNYNFDKRQITYTLRDVSNSNNIPQRLDQDGYIYEIPFDLG